METAKLKRCPRGTRRNKKTGRCDPKEVKAPTSAKASTTDAPKKRCPRGSRRDKKTGACVPNKPVVAEAPPPGLGLELVPSRVPSRVSTPRRGNWEESTPAPTDVLQKMKAVVKNQTARRSRPTMAEQMLADMFERQALTTAVVVKSLQVTSPPHPMRLIDRMKCLRKITGFIQANRMRVDHAPAAEAWRSVAGFSVAALAVQIFTRAAAAERLMPPADTHHRKMIASKGVPLVTDVFAITVLASKVDDVFHLEVGDAPDIARKDVVERESYFARLIDFDFHLPSAFDFAWFFLFATPSSPTHAAAPVPVPTDIQRFCLKAVILLSMMPDFYVWSPSVLAISTLVTFPDSKTGEFALSDERRDNYLRLFSADERAQILECTVVLGMLKQNLAFWYAVDQLSFYGSKTWPMDAVMRLVDSIVAKGTDA